MSYSTHTHTTVLRPYGFCLGQPGWVGTRRNIHPLTPIMVINHPLPASSIYYDLWHPPCSIHGPDSLFPQSLRVFFGQPLGLAPSTSYSIHFFTHCFLFTTHAHTIATCFTVVPRLCYLILISLSTLYLEFIFLSYGPGLTSHTTAVQSPSRFQWCMLIGKQWYQLPEFILSHSDSVLIQQTVQMTTVIAYFFVTCLVVRTKNILISKADIIPKPILLLAVTWYAYLGWYLL